MKQIYVDLVESQYQIKRQDYMDFLTKWNTGKFGAWCFGQAFFKHFQLKRFKSDSKLLEMKGMSHEAASKVIGQWFRIN